MPMNATFLEDLQDGFNSHYNDDEEWNWVRQELDLWACRHFDHVIIKGPLSKKAKRWLRNVDNVTVTDGPDNTTIFSGWAKTTLKGKLINSEFSQEHADAENKSMEELDARRKAVEEQEARQQEEARQIAKKEREIRQKAAKEREARRKEENDF